MFWKYDKFITYYGCPLLCSFPLLSSVTADVLWRSKEPWSAQRRITTQEETQALWDVSIPSLHQLSGKEHLQIFISSCERAPEGPSERAPSVSLLQYIRHLAFSWNVLQVKSGHFLWPPVSGKHFRCLTWKNELSKHLDRLLMVLNNRIHRNMIAMVCSCALRLGAWTLQVSLRL